MKIKFFTLIPALIASMGTMLASISINGVNYNLNETDLTAEVVGGSSDSIFIPNSITYNARTYIVTSISDRSFSTYGITSITIPNSITSIGEYAFTYCHKLKSVYIADIVAWCAISFHGKESNPMYQASDLYLNYELITNLVIPNSVTSIGEYAFYGCTNLTSIELPNSVTSIGDYAFYGCSSLTSLEIPNSVTSIGWYAFRNCSSLTSVSIPESVTTIGLGGTFQGCTELNIVKWNAKECKIEANTNNSYYPPFYNLENITAFLFGENVTHIPACICCGLSGLDKISLPLGVKSIGFSAFRLCSKITSIEIPDNVTNIEESAFRDCSNLTSINIPITVESIKDNTFSGCKKLTIIDFHQSIKDIGRKAFYKCANLTSLNLPGVTSIGDSAFADCSSLTSVEFPSALKSIGDYAFADCQFIESIKNHAERPQNLSSSTNAFKNVDQAICTLYVPEESVDLYKRAAVWKDFYIESIPETQPQAVECKISYLDKNDYELDAETIKLHFPEAPELENFTFMGWQPIAAIINGEIKLQAIYKSNTSDAPSVVTNPSNPAQKLIRNGSVYILTDDSRTYTLTGQLVK